MEYESQPSQGLQSVSPVSMLRVKVIHRKEIAPGVASVSVVLIDTPQAPAPYLPGQFVTLALPTPRETLYRSYSLCSDGDLSRPWELTLKRMEAGAVSTCFFDSVQTDTLLYASLPRGIFTLPAYIEPQAPLVMVALGTGIIPIMGMLRAINRMPADERPLVHLHYASRSTAQEIFGAELAEMDREQRWLNQWVYYSDESQQLTAEDALAHSGSIATSAHWYMCGPASLKQRLQAHLQHIGVAPSRIHSEVFATSSGLAYGGASDEGGVDLGRGVDGQVVSPVSKAPAHIDRTDGYLLRSTPYPVDGETLAGDSVTTATTAKYSAIRQLIGKPDPYVLVRLGAVVCVAILLLTVWRLTDQQPASRAQASVTTISQNHRSVGDSSAPAVASPPPAPQPTATQAPPSRTPAPHPTVPRVPQAPPSAPQPTATRTSRVQPAASAPFLTATPGPVATATSQPVATATPSPTATATPVPVVTVPPTPVVTAAPTPAATVTPAPVVTAAPTPVATAIPTPSATATPSSVATTTPSPVVSPAPTPTP